MTPPAPPKTSSSYNSPWCCIYIVPPRSNRNPYLRSTPQQILHSEHLPELHVRTRFPRTRSAVETRRARNRFSARSTSERTPGRHLHPRPEHIHLFVQSFGIHRGAPESSQTSTVPPGDRSRDPGVGAGGEDLWRGPVDKDCDVDFGATLYGKSDGFCGRLSFS